MITKDSIEEACKAGAFFSLKYLAQELLKERDAYREVAIKKMESLEFCRGFINSEEYQEQEIDAEAQKIMAAKETK